MELADDDELYQAGYGSEDFYDQPSYRTVSRLNNTSTWDSGSDSDSGEEAERFLDDVCRDVANQTCKPVLRIMGRIGDAGVSRLCFALMQNSTVTSLFIRDHEIGPSGAKQLAEALLRNTSLLSLDLLGNAIGDVGAQHLGQLLSRNSTITALRLGANEISYDGAAHLAKALRSNTSLLTLNLAWNYIADAGANHMARMLMENTTLETLDLGGNTIGPPGAKQLSYGLRANNTLSKIYLGGNNLNPAVLESLNLLLATPSTAGDDLTVADCDETVLPKLVWKSWLFGDGCRWQEQEILWEEFAEGYACISFTASPTSSKVDLEGYFIVMVMYDWAGGVRETPPCHARLVISPHDPTIAGALNQALTQEERLEYPYEGSGSSFKVYVQAVRESAPRLKPSTRLRVTFVDRSDSARTEHVLWERFVTVVASRDSAVEESAEIDAEEIGAAAAVAAEEVKRSKEELLDGFLTWSDVSDRATRAMCRRGHWFYVTRLSSDTNGQPSTKNIDLRSIWPSFDVEEQTIADFAQWLGLTSKDPSDDRARLAKEVLYQAQEGDDRLFLSINRSPYSWCPEAFSSFVAFCRKQERLLEQVKDTPKEDRVTARARRAEAKRALEEGLEKELVTVALLVGVQKVNGAMEPLEGPYNDVETLRQTLEESYGGRCIVKVLTDQGASRSSRLRGDGIKRALLTCIESLEEACEGDRRRGQLLVYCAGNCTVRPEGSYFLPSSCPPGEDVSRGVGIAALVATQLLMGRPMLAVMDCVRSGTGSNLVPNSSFGVASGGDQTLTVIVASSEKRTVREARSDDGLVRGRFTGRFAAMMSQWCTEGVRGSGRKETCSAPDVAEQLETTASRSDGLQKLHHGTYPIVHSSEERTFRCFQF